MVCNGFEPERVQAELRQQAESRWQQAQRALVSLLDANGQPTIVERAWIVPPRSQIGPITPDQRQRLIQSSTFYGHYERMIDRESAYELLKKRAAAPAVLPAPAEPKEASKPARRSSPNTGDILGSAAKSVARAAGTQLGRAVIRGVLGSLLR